jgi:hypothetical protein
MNGNTLQGKVINIGEFKYSESPVFRMTRFIPYILINTLG